MTFGLYKGNQVSLFHQRRNEDGHYGIPYLCKIMTPSNNYTSFLGRKAEEGYTSEKLIAIVDLTINRLTRIRGTNRYEVADHALMKYINAFKRICKKQMAMRQVRVRARTRHIHEELVAAAWHPRRVERYLEMGLSIDEICEL